MKNNQMKNAVFLLLVLIVIFSLLSLIFLREMIIQNLVWIVFLIGGLIVINNFDFILELREYERIVVFRMGHFNRVAGPGWVVLLPIIEKFVPVDLRIQTLDIPPQDVITQGNIQLKMDAVVYLKVQKDEQSITNSVINVDDYKNAVKLYVVAAIRDTVGGMTLDQLIANVESLNIHLKRALEKVASEWGVVVDAVEIQDIKIPNEVLDAMHERKAAEQKKLSRMESAAAHRAEIDAVREATESLSDRALSYYYIRALEKMSEGKSTKIVFPMEISKLAGLISSKIGSASESKPLMQAPKLDSKSSTESLILENKDKIANLFGEEFANNLVNVVKKEKKEKTKKEETKKEGKE